MYRSVLTHKFKQMYLAVCSLCDFALLRWSSTLGGGWGDGEGLEGINEQSSYLNWDLVESWKKSNLAILVKENSDDQERDNRERSWRLCFQSKKTNRCDLHKYDCNYNVVMNVWPISTTCLVCSYIHIFNMYCKKHHIIHIPSYLF